MERTSKKDYRPTDQDILHTRMPTTGVVKLDFVLKGIDFHVYDVGESVTTILKYILDGYAVFLIIGIFQVVRGRSEENGSTSSVSFGYSDR